MMPKCKRAFTFIEITVVAAIICILVAIAVPNFMEAKTRASVASSIYSMVEIQQALERYRLDHRMYPLNDPSGNLRGKALRAVTTPVAYMTHVKWDIFTIPEDPKKYSKAKKEPYGYYNAMEYKPEEGLTCKKPLDENFDGFVGGLIFAHGPAHLDGFDTNFTSITQLEGIANLLPYDPTNGGQSNGDLYRRLP